ncbi:MAG: FAD-dependent oxidoreductase [Desulfobacca sp.]|uniref:FAD-dependent oxidoreductase n=1 Tax=Desulfobacca sp. TaxID=2067990 RepID=UPI00404BA2E2
MEERKYGVYICQGCGIGEAVKLEGLEKAARKNGKIPHIKSHPILCSPEGLEFLKGDMAAEGINCAVICACSPRVKYEEFTIPGALIERVNIRELVVWTHEPMAEETQLLAEDYVVMGCAKIKKADIPEGVPVEIERAILVIGGGVTGLTAALEAANLGQQVVLVEKEAELGGLGAGLFQQTPRKYPYQELEVPVVFSKIKEVLTNPKIKVLTKSEVVMIDGQPGLYDVTIKTDGKEDLYKIGAVILAAGAKPYDATKLGHLGYGKSDDVVTNWELEKIAADGKILRPSNGKPAEKVVFIQCAGSVDPDHLPYCSAFCCGTSLKQAKYVRTMNPDSLAYIIYKNMRTLGQNELFYKHAQNDPGILLTKGDVTGVEVAEDGSLAVIAENTLLGEKIKLEADLVVLATGLVPATLDNPILNLNYRQGPGLPDLELFQGFADSNFICFQYETRRTGVYAAGAVRQPMDMATAMEDAAGAALKAYQCLEHTAKGIAVHPRAWDQTFPDPFMQRCTSCKRCTEECPFGAIEEDEKGTPFYKVNRCRRCGTCMGACPERIVNFKDFSVDIIGSMVKAMDVPEEGTRIVAFVCENDAYPAIDAAALNRLQLHPAVRFIPVRCLGSFNLVWIADALSRGIDGILIMGCKYGDDYQCHFVKGSELANYRMGKLQETLDRLALESERAQFIEVAINDFDKLPKIIDDFVARVEEIGPNPYKEF